MQAIAVLWCYMSALYLVALWKKDNSIADIGYGGGFVLVTLYTLMVRRVDPALFTLPFQTMAFLIVLWGSRLALRIYFKNRGKPEDFRYAAWRASWKWFRLRSYLQVFMLQGAIILLIVSPILETGDTFILPLYILGLLAWVKGFIFEALGDWQLDQHLHDPSMKGKLMTSGLWRYTRHPNYFGESVMWWGIFLIALSSGTPWYLVVISPLLITFLLLKVSGIPMLEARMSEHPDWASYAAKTNAFIPWFPKK